MNNRSFDYTTFNGLKNSILVINSHGIIEFINEAAKEKFSSTDKKLISVFDIIQDDRFRTSLKEHIKSTNKLEYVFSVINNSVVYYFQVTRLGDKFICSGQSDDEIERLYHLQISTRKKTLEIKNKLLEISLMDKSNLDLVKQAVILAASEVLKCERISFWKIDEEQTAIQCHKMFLLSANDWYKNPENLILKKEDARSYFDYINKEHAFILADDIATHPATIDFYESYSKPLNLCSLLDVPVWHNGKLYAILCAEQIQFRRKWHLEEVQFMLSLSDSVSLCLQTREKNEAENLLKETNEKLLRSNNDLEHFATVAAHDIKSPLRSIVNFISLLEKKYSTELDDSAKEYISYTLQNANYLTQLINEMLSYSKLDQQLSDAEEIDFNELVANILTDQEEYIQEKKGKISIAQKLPKLKIQRNLVYQLFSNIMHNAMKYSHTNNTPHLEISIQENECFYQFEFADNGIGIDDQHAEKIFNLFSRIHSLDQFDGTGIGLATCKKIAELLGGKITYKRRSNPEGSIFIISLPKE